MTAQANRSIEVSVIIPTAGLRPRQLENAVRSVAAQSNRQVVEIVIVDDSVIGIDRTCLLLAASPVPIKFAVPDPAFGQRSSGFQHSTGRWIAFLDDDDHWEPNKLEAQLRIAKEIECEGQLAVVSCRAQHTFDNTRRVVRGVPKRLIPQQQSVARYLFLRRSLSVRRASLFTSTLLVSRALAESVPWRRLPRHQDWDWLLRVDKRTDVKVQHHPDVLAIIHVGSAGSISASSNWRSSLAWARSDAGALMDSSSYSDFIAAQVLRYALSARSVRGTFEALTELVTNRSLPSVTASLIGLSGLVPRKHLQHAMSFSTRSRGGS